MDSWCVTRLNLAEEGVVTTEHKTLELDQTSFLDIWVSVAETDVWDTVDGY